MGKIVCEKHQEAYEQEKSCPYCIDSEEELVLLMEDDEEDDDPMHDLYGFYMP